MVLLISILLLHEIKLLLHELLLHEFLLKHNLLIIHLILHEETGNWFLWRESFLIN